MAEQVAAQLAGRQQQSNLANLTERQQLAYLQQQALAEQAGGAADTAVEVSLRFVDDDAMR